MLYHVPSGSKSPSSGFATGFAAWNALRSAIIVQLLPSTRNTPFGTVGTPCEQPAPARSPYSWLPMKATLETPLTRFPRATLVSLDGSESTTVETAPAGLILEIRPPSTGLFVLPV